MAGFEKEVPPPFFRPGMARICLPLAGLFFAVLVTIGNLPGLAAEMSDAFGDKRLHLFLGQPAPGADGLGGDCHAGCAG
jgi:hypothetical protein